MELRYRYVDLRVIVILSAFTLDESSSVSEKQFLK